MTARVQPDLAILLRRHHAAGKGVTYLAQYFGLSRQTVHNIIRFKTYKNVVDIGQPLEVYEPIKTKPRAKSTPAPPAPNTLTPAPTAPPAGPIPLGSRPGEIRREPAPAAPSDVQPEPETWASSAAGVYHTGTEALDVQPGPVDVQPEPPKEPEPEPEPYGASWGAAPFVPKKKRR